MSNNTCICKGNWQQIIKESEHLIDKKFKDPNGNQYTFVGVVHGSDDYYYGMVDPDGKLMMLSCVGNLNSWELTLIQD